MYQLIFLYKLTVLSAWCFKHLSIKDDNSYIMTKSCESHKELSFYLLESIFCTCFHHQCRCGNLLEYLEEKNYKVYNKGFGQFHSLNYKLRTPPPKKKKKSVWKFSIIIPVSADASETKGLKEENAAAKVIVVPTKICLLLAPTPSASWLTELLMNTDKKKILKI